MENAINSDLPKLFSSDPVSQLSRLLLGEYQIPSMKETEDPLQNEFGTVYQNVGHKTMMALYQNFLKYQPAASHI